MVGEENSRKKYGRKIVGKFLWSENGRKIRMVGKWSENGRKMIGKFEWSMIGKCFYLRI